MVGVRVIDHFICLCKERRRPIIIVVVVVVVGVVGVGNLRSFMFSTHVCTTFTIYLLFFLFIP